MPRDDDSQFQPRWRAHLEALAIARAAEDTVQAQTTRWLLAAAIAVLGLCWLTSAEVAVVTFVAVASLVLALVQRGRLPALRSPAHTAATTRARRVERDLLQQVTAETAPWLHVRDESPIMPSLVNASHLLTLPALFVDSTRTLSGLYAGHVPCCIAHIAASRRVQPVQRRYPTPIHEQPLEVFARGLFMVTDGPRVHGWVSLIPRRAGLFALLDGLDTDGVLDTGLPDIEAEFVVRGSSVSDARLLLTPAFTADMLQIRAQFPDAPVALAMDAGTLTMFVPTETDPFALGNNPAQWENELQRFTDAVAMATELLHAVHGRRADAASRAA